MVSLNINGTERLARLRDLLQNLPCDALLIESPIDLYYLTGLELSAGKLLISQNEACLIVDGRYYQKSLEQPLYPVQLLNEKVLTEWIISSNIHSLGFDAEQTTYQRFIEISLLIENRKKENIRLEIVPIESVVQNLRLIKDAEEISKLRAAAQLGYEGYLFALSLLREGVSEKELALALELFWKERGASRLAFDSIIAFGPNSSMPHYRPDETTLKQNTSVLIDCGVVLSHYHSDMTRVAYFGNPPQEIQTIYPIVEEAKAKAIEACRPGTLIGDLDRIARDWIQSKGYGEYFSHSLGHGVGLEIHENPIIRQTGPFSEKPLKTGMVITIEPGIYLPGIGGVRLEDTILITENGYENFYPSS